MEQQERDQEDQKGEFPRGKVTENFSCFMRVKRDLF